MNKWLFMGYIASEIKMEATKNGSCVLTFQVRVKSPFKDKETNKGVYSYFFMKAFGKTADRVYTYLNVCESKVGSRVICEAFLQNNNYEKDGEKIYRDEYILTSLTRIRDNDNSVEGIGNGLDKG